MNLVEIGPGSGRYTLLALRAFPNARVFAFDVSRSFLDSLQERLNAESLSDRVVSTHLTDDPELMLRTLSSSGVIRKVDAYFSYDAMVHVDLQTLANYFVVASLTLRQGGAISMNVADATSDEGSARLLRSARRVYSERGRPSVKFFWLSPEIICHLLNRLGFSVRFKPEASRDCYFEALLEDVEKARSMALASGFSLDQAP